MKIKAAKIDTFYQQMGQGKPLVMLHGWGRDWEAWAELIPALTEKRELIIPDLPAFGKTAMPPYPPKWDSYDYVKWLAAFLKKVAPRKKVALMGHSLGGKIAALYAAHYPDQVEQIFLVAPAAIRNPLSPHLRLQKKILHLIPRSLKDAFPPAIKNRILTSTGSALDYQKSDLKQQEILKNVIDEDMRDELTKIVCPTSLWWGTKDDATPYKNHRVFLDKIPHAKLETFEGAGHYPFVDAEDEFKLRLEKYL